MTLMNHFLFFDNWNNLLITVYRVGLRYKSGAFILHQAITEKVITGADQRLSGIWNDYEELIDQDLTLSDFVDGGDVTYC